MTGDFQATQQQKLQSRLNRQLVAGVPCKGGLRFPKETVIVFAHLACQEVEASLRKRSDISFKEGSGSSLSLASSVKD